jgi:hypothetical protein
LRTEAQAIARLQHPGIVQVFEIGDHDGRPFIALEFCPLPPSANSTTANRPPSPRIKSSGSPPRSTSGGCSSVRPATPT